VAVSSRDGPRRREVGYESRERGTGGGRIAVADPGVNSAVFIEQKELWDVPFLFMLLSATLAAEWFWRKRKGLA